MATTLSDFLYGNRGHRAEATPAVHRLYITSANQRRDGRSEARPSRVGESDGCQLVPQH